YRRKGSDKPKLYSPTVCVSFQIAAITRLRVLTTVRLDKNFLVLLLRKGSDKLEIYSTTGCVSSKSLLGYKTILRKEPCVSLVVLNDANDQRKNRWCPPNDVTLNVISQYKRVFTYQALILCSFVDTFFCCSSDEMAKVPSDKVFRCKNSTSDQLAYLDRRLDCGHLFHRKCLFTWGYSGIPCTWDQEGIPHPWDSESIPCPKCHSRDGYGRTLCHLDFDKKKSQ
ncbi:hypothetical protein AVEN_62647-1, partial [Araneus ventricosus]